MKNRITFILVFTLLLSSIGLSLCAQQANFKQIELPYSYNALEPYIDAQTMEIHYSKHHAAYTANLNAALNDLNEQAANIEDILKKISEYPVAVRNNAGGFYNHNLFWEILSPKGGGEPRKKLAEAIIKQFGSFDKFKNEFNKAASSRFGSGWAWLIYSDGKLVVTSTANQDCPLMDVVETKGIPLLCLDVWEHAYYLKYQNRRADYIQAFWNVVNWDKVAELYQKAQKTKK